jgi:anti-anti-sigma factor
MPEGHVTHAEKQGVHVLRYFGDVNYILAPGIQRFVDHLIDDGSISGMVFDLTCAQSLDSTNLGLMARVNERLLNVGAANSVIISGNEDIDVVLRSMGFDQTFDMVSSGEPKAGALPVSVAPDVSAEPIEIDSPSANDLRQTMLEAHRALIRLSDAGRLEFEPVVQCLERDLVDHSSDSSRSISGGAVSALRG